MNALEKRAFVAEVEEKVLPFIQTISSLHGSSDEIVVDTSWYVFHSYLASCKSKKETQAKRKEWEESRASVIKLAESVKYLCRYEYGISSTATEVKSCSIYVMPEHSSLDDLKELRKVLDSVIHEVENNEDSSIIHGIYLDVIQEEEDGEKKIDFVWSKRTAKPEIIKALSYLQAVLVAYNTAKRQLKRDLEVIEELKASAKSLGFELVEKK